MDSHPVVLLLPGMSLNATIFPRFDLPTISVDFTRLVLGPDGSSPDLLARRMGVYVDLLDAELGLRGAWQAPQRIVVGHSFGAMLALSWWLAHGGAGPARVDGMVLCSTTAGPLFDVAELAIGGILRVPIAPFMAAWNRPATTRMIKRLLCGRLDQVEAVDFAALPRKTDWALDRAGWRNTDWRAMRAYRLALDGFDVRARLKEVTPPVIVLHGGRDSVLPTALGESLSLRLPRGEFRKVPGAGHGLPATHGEEVRKAVASLCATLRR